MGNHEFCDNCGENIFHYNGECDSKKVTERIKAEKDLKKLKALGVKKLSKLLKLLNINYDKDYDDGYITISTFKFAENSQKAKNTSNNTAEHRLILAYNELVGEQDKV